MTDSSNLPCEIAVVGNSEQETREGYNFLDISNIPSQTVKGITISDNGDGGIKISGTSEGAVAYDIQTNIILEGQYTLSVETKWTTSSLFQFLLRNANNENIML